MTDIFQQLSKPFPSNDIEWRVQRSGEKNGKPWAMVLAYVTNRAIQDRLDDVFGPFGWRNEQKQVAGGWLCGISCKDTESGEWITKWDGADNIQMKNDKTNQWEDSVKAGLSASMKRAAVQWGIGRYLYDLDAGFADCRNDRNGKNNDKIKRQNGQDLWFSWNPPALPEWALPEEERRQSQPEHNKQYNAQRQQPDTAKHNNVHPAPSPAAETRHYHHPSPASAGGQTQTAANNSSNCGTAAGGFLHPDQVRILKDTLAKNGIQEGEFLRICKMERLGQLPARKFQGAIRWVRGHSAGAA